MRIVEFVVAVVALIALFGWLVGRPHTLESLERSKPHAGATHDAAQAGDDASEAAGGDGD
ncbi:MAG TPA: hypothetical protein VIG88_08585 [Lysobacter sp.]